MKTPDDLTGRKFGRLTVASRGDAIRGVRHWNCVCECGRVCTVSEGNLKSSHTRSCGCLQREAASKASTRHKEVNTHLYIVWADMKSRCKNPNNNGFHLYGGRGIAVCEEWEDYLAFRKWAHENGYSDELSLDRIDPNGNYEPANCRWILPCEQALNKRNTFYLTINGETKPAKVWALESGTKYETIFMRKKYLDWNDHDAVFGREKCKANLG